MVSSADVAILFKVAELAKRFGLRPSEADGFVYLNDRNTDLSGNDVFVLEFGSVPGDPVVREKWERFTASLGIEADSGMLRKPHLSDIEDAVDHALSLAPNARYR